MLNFVSAPVMAQAVLLSEVQEPASTSTLTTVLGNVGSVISSVAGWTSDVLGMIASTPLLMIPIGIGVAFAVLGLARRMLHVR